MPLIPDERSAEKSARQGANLAEHSHPGLRSQVNRSVVIYDDYTTAGAPAQEGGSKCRK